MYAQRSPDSRHFLCVQVRVLVASLHGQKKREHGMRTRGPKKKEEGILVRVRQPRNEQIRITTQGRSLHLERRTKNGVNVRLVHVGSSHCTRLITFVHEGHHFIIASNDELAQILDVRSQARMLANPEVARILWIEQVSHFLVIDLGIRLVGWYWSWI